MSKNFNRNEKSHRMVQISMFSAVIVVLQLLATFLIRVGAVAPTLALIPLVIGASAFGVKAGAILGGVFSLVAFICGLTGFDAFTNAMIMYKPLETIAICFLKGILAGIAAALVYKGCEKIKKNKTNVFIPSLLAAIIAPVINTSVYVAGMALFFREMVTDASGTPIYSSNEALITVLIGVFAIIIGNFILEVIVTGVATPIVTSVLAKSRSFKKLFIK